MIGSRADGSFRKVRRLLVAMVAALGLGAPQAGAGVAGRDLENELVVVATGGALEQAFREHFYEPFTKATGVTIRAVAANDADQWTKVKAMTMAGDVEWDIVSGTNVTVPVHREFLARLDCAAIPNAAAFGVAGTCQEHALLRSIGGVILAYSTKAFPAGRHPRSWADFWDVQRFPGPRALPNIGAPWSVLAPALLADGVPPDALFPLDLDRAFRKLDQLKPHVKVWWKSGDQSQQIMRSGEVVMAQMWSGRALSLKAAGAPVDVEWNQGVKDVAYWAVLKSAPHPKAAMAFLDFFMSRPQAHLAYTRRIFYETSNRRLLDLVPEAERRAYATHPVNWGSMVDVAGHPWVAEHRAEILERWNAWLAK